MAGPGNKGNLGPAPRVPCTARVFAPGPVWSRRAPGHAARSGKHKPRAGHRRRPQPRPTCSGRGHPGVSGSAGERDAGSAAGGGEGEAAAGGRGWLRRRREARVGGRRHVTAVIVLVYKVPPAGRVSHLACARPSPAVLHAPSTQLDAQRADGADMGRAMVARLGLGLLLLALLLPTQIYSNETNVTTLSSNSSQITSATPNPTNATSPKDGSALQSTASLFVVSLSLLHLYC
nr:signal transducer CD24 [Dasypus novemcinctus]